MQQQSQNMKLPLGCRFLPKDRELITYLSNKAKGLPDIGEGFITDGVDVYGTSPNDLRANSGHKKKYYFTPTKFKKAPSRCRVRRTPDGHWKSNDKKHEVFDKEGKMVGFVQDFTHKGGTNDGRTAQNWKMKEYTLPENDSSDHVALCVIYSPRDNTKKPDKNANSSQMLVQNQSTLPNKAFQGLPPAPAPADGITTDCPNDDDSLNGLPPLELESELLGSSSRNDDDSNLASLKSDVGWQESILWGDVQDLFLATLPFGSGSPESSFVDNEAASILETPLLEIFY